MLARSHHDLCLCPPCVVCLVACLLYQIGERGRGGGRKRIIGRKAEEDKKDEDE